MTPEEIIKGNRLIAEFMRNSEGYSIIKYNKDRFLYDNPKLIEHAPIEALDYHCSYDWIMPVVEKIESIENINITINFKSCRIFNFTDSIVYTITDLKINSIYLAVIGFIKWYHDKAKTSTKATV